MNAGHDWTRLQQIADYRMARKTLKAGAIGSMIFGAISLALGIAPPFDPISTTVGAVLFGTGLWNLTRPQPAGIIIDGATLLLVGSYNILLALGALGAGGASFWLRIGIFQLVWGVQAVMRYAKFREAFAFSPQDTEVRQFDELVRSIEKAKLKESTDTIEFTTTGFQAKRWRGRLTDTGAFLLILGSNDVTVVGKHDFDVQENGKVLIGSARKAGFTIKGKTHKGALPPQSLERYQMWKTGTVMPAAIAA